ncbi:hypothetical protein E0Z10_g1504 [Xylaria hypoxylon]|uniref:Uncharacterized protein n=1 Tax=Xylaria hypoxylon TaxID=37992 RepID=A0A4Z0Z6Y2_9PEZI|nr:hypothetical protein E0Z10_g1504 [Xylaria hypoxylon]
MSGGGAASVPCWGASVPSPTAQVPNMSDDEFKDFRKIFETRLLPSITKIINAENIGGQVYFRRSFITIDTREEAPPSFKQQIECAVDAELRENLRAKVSLEFQVGALVRTGS